MELSGVEESGIRAVEGRPDMPWMAGVEAGAILQKLRNYRVRLAVVCPPGSARFSSRFGEMLVEERPRAPLRRLRDALCRGMAGPLTLARSRVGRGTIFVLAMAAVAHAQTTPRDAPAFVRELITAAVAQAGSERTR